MELESLKYIWHSLEAPTGSRQDRQALLALLKKKSQAPVARMRRNLIGEGILLLVAYTPAILIFLLGFNGRLVAISWLFIFVLVLFFGYYYRKYRLLNKMQCPTCQLKIQSHPPGRDAQEIYPILSAGRHRHDPAGLCRGLFYYPLENALRSTLHRPLAASC